MTAEPTYRGFALDAQTALALLQWQAELGADEPCLDDPIDRYDLPDRAEAPAATASAAPTQPTPRAADPAVDHAALAETLAAGASTLAELAAAQEAFEPIEIRRGARNFCFADGRAGARVMVIGEAPGEEEDQQGRPFVGRAGQLLDRMFAAIGLARDAVDAERGLYITNVLPWRPPGNRRPEPGEIAVMLPFLRRHVELAQPELLVLMGNTPCIAALNQQGILRLRGQWTQAFDLPTLPMTHPAYLLRTPLAKREAWADLLSIAARLDTRAAP
ncbi:uracil-DNA glycosylase [Paracoccus shanxieyensis]|uniref:Type-4 uracil-DNA glycosylase n=1 Tax=Paracoccus shanxieyensis TaxID=2675752 RepID=A0A6L6ISM5_9RHOB|nr:uracil-DNA glycosylase [Paracoccus shanxieyensis]MTH62859.1 uracil-DNA glycosylase [Paracoccus shanxieyensis]MTH86057.1 uracil-DNA glycosylase [Paracoccus shanxieyensis]